MSEPANPYAWNPPTSHSQIEQTPLAVYRDRYWLFRRNFQLYDDKILIKTWRMWWVLGDLTVNLAGMRSEPNRLFIRAKLLNAILAAGVTTLVLFQTMFIPAAAETTNILAVLCVVTWLYVIVAVCRPIEFAQFVNLMQASVFDIARAGPDRASFDQFVGLIVEQIRNSATPQPSKEAK